MTIAPQDQNWAADLCNFIRSKSTTGEALTLATLARRSGMSPFHLQRKFKTAMGLTPKQYLEACRMETLKTQLRSKKSVAEATYEAGFGSSRGVYERVDSRLGMTPRTYGKGGEKTAISYVTVESPLGLLMLAATDRGLCLVQFGESSEELQRTLRREFPAAKMLELQEPYPEQFHLWMNCLSNYLNGTELKLDLPLDLRGTTFQWMVWEFLRSIPAGEVASYTAVAEGIGQPKAARAVGHACATNPVALVIPCHRVLRGDGDLGGYRWGIERKQQLLEHERVVKRSV